MATVINVPSTEDFNGYQNLVAKQSEHFSPMMTWAGMECSDTDGLDGVLTLAKKAVPPAAHFISDKLSRCQRGMGLIKDKIAAVDSELRTEDEKNAAALRNLFPGEISGTPDIGALPKFSNGAANFQDEEVSLKEPANSNTSPTFSDGGWGDSVANWINGEKKDKDKSKDKDKGDGKDGDESSKKSSLKDKAKDGTKNYMSGKAHDKIENQKKTIRENFNGAGREIWVADKAYKMVTGHSFIDQIFKPLMGDWDRLIYLHDAYDTLGDGCYTVTGTLRKASWKIGSEWKGDTATAFDSYLFRWTMGIGGVGDAAKVIALAFKECHDIVLKLVASVVNAVGRLIDNAIRNLAKQAAEMIAGDAVIETVGLGPEDPVADAVAGVFTAEKMLKVYQAVHLVVSGVAEIIKLYKEIKSAAEKLTKDIEKAYNSISQGGWPSVGSVVADVESKGFDFERSGSSSSGGSGGGGDWVALAGVARIGVLPQA